MPCCRSVDDENDGTKIIRLKELNAGNDYFLTVHFKH